MPDRFTENEFAALMKRWDETERQEIGERLRGNFSRPELEQFSRDEAATLRAALERLIPQREGVDLVGFLDWAVGKPLGRGDRQPGMPDEPEMFHLGLKGLDETASHRFGRPFHAIAPDQRDDVLRAVQEGKSEGAAWRQMSGQGFFMRFYTKALLGYFAHPKAWMRIGFPGPAYPEGYLWVNSGQVKERHRRRAGWDRF